MLYFFAGAGALISLALGWGVIEHQRAETSQVREQLAQRALVQQQAALDAIRSEKAAAVLALEDRAKMVRALTDSMTRVRNQVSAQPRTVSCMASPAVVAAVAGLRRTTSTGGAGDTSGSSTLPVSVPGPTGTATSIGR